MSCQITMASDARTQTSFVFKFCVGSHQDLTHKLSTASAFLKFVSDPINIRHKKKQSLLCCQILCRIPSTSDTKKTKPIVFPSFVSDPVNIRHKNQSLLCFQIWCRIQILCRIPSASDTKKSKAGGVSTFWIESHQPLTQKWKLPSFKCRLKNLCVSTFCVGSHQDPTQNENYLVTCIPRTFGGDHVFLEALDKSAIQKLQRGETNLSQIPSGQTQEF